MESVRAILAHAEHDVAAARSPAAPVRLHKAEQVLLLARLAADSGARRGELAALHVDDLDGDVLTIARGHPTRLSGPPKPAGSAG